MEKTTMYAHGDYREGLPLSTPRVTIGRPHPSNKPKWTPKAAMGLIALIAAISVGWVARDLAGDSQPTRLNVEAPAASQAVDQIGNVHLGDGFGAILTLDPNPATENNVHLGDGFGAILALDPNPATENNVHLGDGFGAILALDPNPATENNVHLGDGFGAILALDPNPATENNVHLGDGFGAILTLDPNPATENNVHLGDGFGAILTLDPDDG